MGRTVGDAIAACGVGRLSFSIPFLHWPCGSPSCFTPSMVMGESQLKGPLAAIRELPTAFTPEEGVAAGRRVGPGQYAHQVGD